MIEGCMGNVLYASNTLSLTDFTITCVGGIASAPVITGESIKKVKSNGFLTYHSITFKVPVVPNGSTTAVTISVTITGSSSKNFSDNNSFVLVGDTKSASVGVVTVTAQVVKSSQSKVYMT